MEWIYLLVLILVVLVARRVFDNKPRKEYEEIPHEKVDTFSSSNYEVRKTLMTPNERLFFEKLKRAIGDKFDIYPQVNLDKIFRVKFLASKYKFNAAKWAIDRRSVDFLVVNRNNQSPLFAIEIDDSSHTREDRIARDEKVGSLFKDNGIDLVRFNSTDNFLEEELKKVVEKHYVDRPRLET